MKSLEKLLSKKGQMGPGIFCAIWQKIPNVTKNTRSQMRRPKKGGNKNDFRRKKSSDNGNKK